MSGDQRTPKTLVESLDLPPALRTESYDYELPEALIAQEPAADRTGARLLHLGRDAEGRSSLQDLRIPDLATLLGPGDLLVLNDTRVVPARLFGVREATGGRCEVLLVEARDGGFEALVKTRGTLREGEGLTFAGGRIRARVAGPADQGQVRLAIEPDGPALRALLDEVGRIPLPPYIRRAPEADPRDALDRERYQTVFAAKEGAVAAPTAGLHLDERLLAALRARGVSTAAVTLHVGPGTFRPVTAEDVRRHRMHEEAYEVPAEAAAAIDAHRARGGRVVAVGTTVVRVLESAADAGGRLRPGAGRTRLFIHEPYRFRVPGALLTNFHAPRSTLLMLVAAFAGRERLLDAYRHAIAARYRLLSYGDAMLVEP